MLMGMKLAAVIVCTLSAILLSAPAFGQTATGPPAARRGPSDFQAAMNDGHRAMVARDFGAANAAYQRAASLQADSAEPHLFMGFARRAQGQTAEAIEAFRTAARMAQAGDETTRAKALFNIAAALEATQNLDGARAAWQEYVSFADSHATITSYPASGRARVQAIDRVAELGRAYEDVRRRIADRERQNAAGGR